MGSPISPLEAIELIQNGLALYQKVTEDVPEQMTRIAKRMKSLEAYLLDLKNILDPKKNATGIAVLMPAKVLEINTIIEDTRDDAQKIYDIIYRWQNNTAFAGFQWKYDWFAHVVFGLGSSPDKLDALSDNLNTHLNDIHRWISSLNLAGINALIVGPPYGQGNNRSPSPRPKPAAVKPRKDVNILFVDGYGESRCRVAEAYTKLLKAQANSPKWKGKGPVKWPVSRIHAAGIYPRHQSDVVDCLRALNLKTSNGQKPMNAIALESVFDNKFFSSYAFKEEIRSAMVAQRSKGLRMDTFSMYDLVVVFTKLQQVSISRLRAAMIKSHGKHINPPGKGKIVFLGDYFGNGKEIFEPGADRAKWNRTTSDIKIAVRGMLLKEFGFKRECD